MKKLKYSAAIAFAAGALVVSSSFLPVEQGNAAAIVKKSGGDRTKVMDNSPCPSPSPGSSPGGG